jgi:2-dehydropantoate 2-reductase
MMLNILVVGAGAIGCFVGGHLAASGHRVTLVGRPRLMKKITEDGLILQWPDRPNQTVFPEAATTVVDPAPVYDFIFLTVKSPDTIATAEQLATLPLAAIKTYLVSFQNGIGNEEQLVKTFGSPRVIAGTITIPIRVPELGTIEVSKANGGLGLAPLDSSQPVDVLADALNRAGLTTMTYADYRSMKWSKLLLNIVTNASCAILNQPPPEVIARPDLFNLEIKALQEGVAVMKAQGIKAVILPGYRTDRLARLAPARWLPLAVTRSILRPYMISGRGTKMPSLQIDLAAGRSRSEIDALNGAIVQAGQRLDVPTPVNQALTRILKGLVSGELAWTDYQNQPEKLIRAVQQGGS